MIIEFEHIFMYSAINYGTFFNCQLAARLEPEFGGNSFVQIRNLSTS